MFIDRNIGIEHEHLEHLLYLQIKKKRLRLYINHNDITYFRNSSKMALKKCLKLIQKQKCK